MPMTKQTCAIDLCIVQSKDTLTFYVFDMAEGDVVSKAFPTMAQAEAELLQLIS
jgi:hypothetical protein